MSAESAGRTRGQQPRGAKGPCGAGGRTKPPASLPDARRVAVEALLRIDQDGAYANLLLPKLLERSGLADRDRAFVTQLVYGTTRYRRACDWFVDRFALGDLDPTVRASLRLGTYQLRMLGTPPHAAVSATVDTVPRRARGLVNAVLRKIADADDAWPSEAVRLSYPDWVVERITADLGAADALASLESMNGAATTVERADGYVQDQASQWVADAVGARSGELVLDLCAAPGGKATALAGDGATVVASDSRRSRVGLVVENRDRLGLGIHQVPVLVADGTRPPFAPGSFDRVLVDAPCSGIGSLRRRPDARWRLDPQAPERLAELQGRLLAAAATLVRPGGTLVYSVCTLTAAETTGVADVFTAGNPPWSVADGPGDPWRPWGSGVILLPHVAGTDGMALFRWQAPGGGADTAPDAAADVDTAPAERGRPAHPVPAVEESQP